MAHSSRSKSVASRNILLSPKGLVKISAALFAYWIVASAFWGYAPFSEWSQALLILIGDSIVLVGPMIIAAGIAGLYIARRKDFLFWYAAVNVVLMLLPFLESNPLQISFLPLPLFGGTLLNIVELTLINALLFWAPVLSKRK